MQCCETRCRTARRESSTRPDSRTDRTNSLECTCVSTSGGRGLAIRRSRSRSHRVNRGITAPAAGFTTICLKIYCGMVCRIECFKSASPPERSISEESWSSGRISYPPLRNVTSAYHTPAVVISHSSRVAYAGFHHRRTASAQRSIDYGGSRGDMAYLFIGNTLAYSHGCRYFRNRNSRRHR